MRRLRCRAVHGFLSPYTLVQSRLRAYPLDVPWGSRYSYCTYAEDHASPIQIHARFAHVTRHGQDIPTVRKLPLGYTRIALCGPQYCDRPRRRARRRRRPSPVVSRLERRRARCLARRARARAVPMAPHPRRRAPTRPTRTGRARCARMCDARADAMAPRSRAAMPTPRATRSAVRCAPCARCLID